jgi:membrane protease YdiL (CAAX protease family)
MSLISPDAPPGPPAPRGRPLLAWLVIAGVVAFILLRSSPEQEERKEQLDLVMMEMQTRYLVGWASMAGKAPQLYEQMLATFDRGPYGQRLRVAIVAGELSGVAEANKQLAQLRQLTAGKKIQPTTEDESLTEILTRLYGSGDGKTIQPAAIGEAGQSQLREELGWFGLLALGAPGGDATDRDAALASARRTCVVLLVCVVAGLILALSGFVLLIVLLVLLVNGRLRSHFGPSSGLGVYVETFALWFALYVLLSYGLSFLPHSRNQLLFSSLAMLVSLLALAWPVLRGIPWQQVRRDIGLHLGQRPWLEGLLGAGCYISALPLLFIGLLLTALLMLLKRKYGLGENSFGPSDNPGHPATLAIIRGDWWIRVQMMLTAVVVAPLAEETLFRGLLYRHLRDATHGWGARTSVVLSALLVSFVFAVIHPQGIVAVPGLMALAFTFALAREWRGTLLPAMLAHGINNGALTLMLMLAVG